MSEFNRDNHPQTCISCGNLHSLLVPVLDYGSVDPDIDDKFPTTIHLCITCLIKLQS